MRSYYDNAYIDDIDMLTESLFLDEFGMKL